ncbi:hypothetical protein V8F20_010469 [Naviculisporaceae sp. PSN 640]
MDKENSRSLVRISWVARRHVLWVEDLDKRTRLGLCFVTAPQGHRHLACFNALCEYSMMSVPYRGGSDKLGEKDLEPTTHLKPRTLAHQGENPGSTEYVLVVHFRHEGSGRSQELLLQNLGFGRTPQPHRTGTGSSRATDMVLKRNKVSTYYATQEYEQKRLRYAKRYDVARRLVKTIGTDAYMCRKLEEVNLRSSSARQLGLKESSDRGIRDL